MALGLSLFGPVLARHLDGQLAGFRPRVGEEAGVGEAMLHQRLGQRLLLRDAVEVRGMPERTGLRRQRRRQRRMRVAQHIDRDARPEVEKASPVRFHQPASLARDEAQGGTVVGGQDGGDHGLFLIWGGASGVAEIAGAVNSAPSLMPASRKRRVKATVPDAIIKVT